MRKLIKVSFVLCMALFVMSFLGCRFAPLSIEEAKSNLENAGYEVKIVDGSTFVDSKENPYPFIFASELEKYLVATKDSEEIHMYFFYNVDQASNNYSMMTNSKLSSGQNNQLVYFGTKQAIKDAGL